MFGIDSLMAFNPPRIFDVYRRYAGAPLEAFMREATRIPPDAVLDKANVAFIATRKGFPNIEQTAASDTTEAGSTMASRSLRAHDPATLLLFQ